MSELELARPVSDLLAPTGPAEGTYQRARLLVRVHGQPIGFVEVRLREGVVPAIAMVRAIEASLGQTISDHLRADGIRPGRLTESGVPAVESPLCNAAGPHGDPEAFASVIVCTRDRSASLRRTLRSLLDGDYPHYEILVVDSAPTTDATQRVVTDLGDAARYLCEPLPGLSRARNRGVREARGGVLAFTDDDVIADRAWLRHLVLGFTRAPNVGCVTGLVPPAKLDTPAQAFFDRKVHWSTGTERVMYDLDTNRLEGPLYPYTAGIFGAGVNFGLSMAAARRVGDFDEALGAGSPAHGGEDLDYLLRVVLAGLTISYEPAAIVWHLHRRDEDALRRQIQAYGSGLSAFAFKQLLSRETAWDVIRRLLPALRRLGLLVAPQTDLPGLPARLWADELRGFLLGPLNYVRGRRQLRGLESRCNSGE